MCAGALAGCEEYAGLVALCQMLPGPASSQVGFLIGLRRAGWAARSLPGRASRCPRRWRCSPSHGGTASARDHDGFGVLHGLQLVAVAVVAQAVWSMARTLCPDRRRTALALLAAVLLLVAGGPVVQIAALLLGAAGGALLCRDIAAAPGRRRCPWPAARAGSRSPRSRSCSWACRPWRQGRHTGCWRSPPSATAPARWCSAAVMSCCRCCATLWCRTGG